jgi:hypothetical protein
VDKNSTFSGLARIALARYAKEEIQHGVEAEITSILDEKDCAMDMEDGVDLVEQGEILKLVLAPSSHDTISQPQLTVGLIPLWFTITLRYSCLQEEHNRKCTTAQPNACCQEDTHDQSGTAAISQA